MATQAGESIERSPSDVLRLAVAVVVLVVARLLDRLVGDDVLSFTSDLLAGLQELPDGLLTAVVVATKVAVALVLVGGVVWAVAGQRWRLLATVGVAVAIAALYAIGDESISRAADAVATSADALGDVGDPVWPSVVGLAVASAVFTAAAPWLSRRTRRIGWVLLFAVVFSRFVTAPLSFDGVIALLWGWAAGAAAIVALGAPLRRPTADAVVEGLRAVGLDIDTLEPAAVDARGSTPYFGSGGGRKLFVKVLGSDERSADLLFRTYRALHRRALGDERPFSSLRRAVEHEALVAFAARDLGIRTPRVLGFASVEPAGFVLAYEGIDGSSLDGVESEEMTDDLLDGVWGQIALLREHRIAHRDLRLANVFRTAGGEAWMIDFGFSELAASDLLLATDVAELLASLSLAVGPERAVAVARRTLGDDAVRSAEPRLRPLTLSGATRKGMKDNPGLLVDLCARVRSLA